MSDAKQAPKKVEVQLNQAHTHQGTSYKADEKIWVLPHTAAYLEKHKIGKRV